MEFSSKQVCPVQSGRSRLEARNSKTVFSYSSKITTSEYLFGVELPSSEEVLEIDFNSSRLSGDFAKRIFYFLNKEGFSREVKNSFRKGLVQATSALSLLSHNNLKRCKLVSFSGSSAKYNCNSFDIEATSNQVKLSSTKWTVSLERLEDGAFRQQNFNFYFVNENIKLLQFVSRCL